MRLKFLLLSVFLIPSLTIVGQGRIFVAGTVGQYSMRTLKELQEDMNNQFVNDGMETKIVTAFPVSLQVDAGYLKEYSTQYSGGPYLNYAMTKGRSHYADYSGEIYADQIVSRIVLGGKCIRHLKNGFALHGKLAFDYSMLSIEFATIIHGAGNEQESHSFYSFGFNAEPGVSWTYKKGKFSFDINVGYEFNLQGKTFVSESTEAYLQTRSGNKVVINWSGIRTGIGVNYRVNYSAD